MERNLDFFGTFLEEVKKPRVVEDKPSDEEVIAGLKTEDVLILSMQEELPDVKVLAMTELEKRNSA